MFASWTGSVPSSGYYTGKLKDGTAEEYMQFNTL